MDASTILEQLESSLKSHDWWYGYSDDHRSYTTGSREQKQIRGLIKQFEDSGFGDKAQEMYNKYLVEAKGL